MEKTKRICAGIIWVILWLPNFLWQEIKFLLPVIGTSVEREKRDIIERSNWLERQILVSPKRLMDKMPGFFSEHIKGEWSIYACSHYSAALLNISQLYPEERETCVSRLGNVVKLVLDPVLRRYDTTQWKEDALESLQGDNSHMTYLSILSWVITNYKLAGGDERFDGILHDCCKTLNRRMLQGGSLNLLSFPGSPVFVPDMMFCIAALHNYSLLFEGRYASTVKMWLGKAKTEWLDRHTGVLSSMLTSKGRHIYGRLPRGSYTALNCYCLTLIDDEFARDQYGLMKLHFVKRLPFFGLREYLNRNPFFAMDIDAGPIIFGLSPSGSAWALGAATFFNDFSVRRRLMKTAAIAGITVRGWKKRHYLLGRLAIVGEAVALAMRTNLR